MFFRPEPIDPKKDLFEEIVRYTREYRRYLRACEPGGENEHGPWPKLGAIPSTDHLKHTAPKPYDDFTSEHYWNDRRWYDGPTNSLHDW